MFDVLEHGNGQCHEKQEKQTKNSDDLRGGQSPKRKHVAPCWESIRVAIDQGGSLDESNERAKYRVFLFISSVKFWKWPCPVKQCASSEKKHCFAV